MKIIQIYTKCLSQGSYYIESNGEVAIIDPLRDTQQYIELALENDARIKYIFETHFHADFVSGHVELAHQTGAEIVYGPGATTEFDIINASDGQHFSLGDLTFEVLHTPGHTLESVCYLLLDKKGDQHSIFTGDTLFLGDVGRPDLSSDPAITKENLAKLLFNSLQTKILPLNDQVIIYPGHGAGTACGKNLSSSTTGTIGEQRKTNYALNASLTEDAFVDILTKDLAPPPPYFQENAKLNKAYIIPLGQMIDQPTLALSIESFKSQLSDSSTLILDTRNADDFANAFIQNSVNVGLKGSFAPWMGSLFPDLQQPIVFICDEGTENEVITRLARVGFSNIKGYLSGGIKSWLNESLPISQLNQISEKSDLENIASDVLILDVRKPSEIKNGHVEHSISVPLSQDIAWEEFDQTKTYYVYCAGGYRSMIFSTLAMKNGLKNIVNMKGGYKQYAEKTILSACENK